MKKNGSKGNPRVGVWDKTNEDAMTLRDHFAGQALIGLIASPELHDDVYNDESCAEKAYKIADAMLKERWKS